MNDWLILLGRFCLMNDHYWHIKWLKVSPRRFNMVYVDHVTWTVGFRKVCRMIVPSSDLEVMINLQLSAIVQKYTYTLNSRLSIRAYIALQVCELVWMMSSWSTKVVRIGEDWWTRQSCLVWEEARLPLRCQINVMWARVLLEVPPKGRNLNLNSFDHHVCWIKGIQWLKISQGRLKESMFYVGHVACTVGFHKVCRMNVPWKWWWTSSHQPLLISGFAQECTHAQSQTIRWYTLSCKNVSECEWWLAF
jgi:hypothetical protein